MTYHITTEQHDGRWQQFLNGKPLSPGDMLDVYLPTLGFWLRGRYEWAQLEDSPARLTVNHVGVIILDAAATVRREQSPAPN